MTAAAHALARAGLIGAATGLRSQYGLAAVSLTGAHHPAGPGVSFLTRRWVRVVTVSAAAGEFLADKSPRIPDRLSPAGLGPRLVFASLAAAVLTVRHRGAEPVLLGTAGGACAAAATAFAGAKWREPSSHRAFPDAVAAVIEDLVALALARAACGPVHHAGSGDSPALAEVEEVMPMDGNAPGSGSWEVM
ncbi:DUF4126 family protein [Streptomyces sp. NPDC051320]|uniref:DUF4126 family protein n=1 Tax=Streptomyces sp. NPDC051320 TaxID=3154644 RepID=UPI0034201C95